MDEDYRPLADTIAESETILVSSSLQRQDEQDEGWTHFVWNLTDLWWIFVVRGVAQTVFGLFFLFHPAEAWTVLSTIFGVYLVVDTTASLLKALLLCLYCCRRRSDGNGVVEAQNDETVNMPSRGRTCILIFLYLVSFAVNLSLGIFAFQCPQSTVKPFVFMTSIWLIVVGVMQFWLACYAHCHDLTSNDTSMLSCLVLVGAVYLIGGVCLLQYNKSMEAIVFLYVVGVGIILYGLQNVQMGIALKFLQRKPTFNGRRGSPGHNTTATEALLEQDGALTEV